MKNLNSDHLKPTDRKRENSYCGYKISEEVLYHPESWPPSYLFKWLSDLRANICSAAEVKQDQVEPFDSLYLFLAIPTVAVMVSAVYRTTPTAQERDALRGQGGKGSKRQALSLFSSCPWVFPPASSLDCFLPGVGPLVATPVGAPDGRSYGVILPIHLMVLGK